MRMSVFIYTRVCVCVFFQIDVHMFTHIITLINQGHRMSKINSVTVYTLFLVRKAFKRFPLLNYFVNLLSEKKLVYIHASVIALCATCFTFKNTTQKTKLKPEYCRN